MPKSMTKTVKYHSDEDDGEDIESYWKPRKKTDMHQDKTLRQLNISEIVSNKTLVRPSSAFHPKISHEKVIDDVMTKLMSQTPLSTLYWECPDGTNLLSLLHETAEDMKVMTMSEGYLIYVVDDLQNELFICSKTLEELEGRKYSWSIDNDKTIAVYVAKERKVALVNNNNVDPRFPDGQDLGDFNAFYILALPVETDKICIAVVELYRLDEIPYTTDDVEKCTYLANLAADVILKNRNVMSTMKDNELNEVLLGNITEKLVHEAPEKGETNYTTQLVNFANHILGSESVTYFLVNENGALERQYTNESNPVSQLTVNKKKMRIAKEIQIAALLQGGENIVNFADVFNDPRFDKAIDRHVGRLIRSVLGCEIVEHDSNHVGVLMAINKHSEAKFTIIDEKILDAIRKYLTCGLKWMQANSDLLQKIRYNSALSDVFIYQLTKRARVSETYIIEETTYIPADFQSFMFIPNDPELLETPKYVFYIFNSLEPKFVPDKDRLYKFIFAAKKLHRETSPFHNFHHAFMCLHTVYLIMKNYPEAFSDVEKYALAMAALLHDCDNRGLSAKYLEIIDHPIINKMEVAPLEAYHFYLGKCILEQTEMLDNLNEKQQNDFFRIFKQCVIGSNLTIFTSRGTRFKDLLDSGEIDLETDEHRKLLRTLLTVAGDLSEAVKSLEQAMHATSAVYEEFYREGDLMRDMNLVPPPIMNREAKNNIPSTEETFCTNIVVPCFELLQRMFPITLPLYENSLEIQKMWKEKAAELKRTNDDINGIIINATTRETIDFIKDFDE